jgi:hypothetical protein
MAGLSLGLRQTKECQMKISIEMLCPSCGGTDFEIPGGIQSHTDCIGVPCAKCGHKLTEREVIEILNNGIVKEARKITQG